MPRDYLRKTHANYSCEDLNLAVCDVRRKNVAIQRSSKMYGVPRSTLRRHVLSGVEQGRPCVLSAGLIIKVIIADILLAKTPGEVREAAHSVALKSAGILMPESWRKNKAAGNDWWLGLIKKKGFIPHFLTAKSNAPKPCLTVDCGNCHYPHSRDMVFSFCNRCCEVICDECINENTANWSYLCSVD